VVVFGLVLALAAVVAPLWWWWAVVAALWWSAAVAQGTLSYLGGTNTQILLKP
jgi:hypothetical protein